MPPFGSSARLGPQASRWWEWERPSGRNSWSVAGGSGLVGTLAVDVVSGGGVTAQLGIRVGPVGRMCESDCECEARTSVFTVHVLGSIPTGGQGEGTRITGEAWARPGGEADQRSAGVAVKVAMHVEVKSPGLQRTPERGRLVSRSCASGESTERTTSPRETQRNRLSQPGENESKTAPSMPGSRPENQS